MSVFVARGRDTLLNRGYGYADLGLRATATAATRYRLIGPGTILLAAAVLRAAEQGRLSLDDDAAKYLPDFPWQGRRVAVRQLLDCTSGLQDYHYLGDDYMRVARTPMRTDEVTALFAGRPFVHEPGAAWSWTISGFHLAGVILERVTGEPYHDYLLREVIRPAGLTGIIYCDGVRATPGLARGYRHTGRGLGADVLPTVSAVRFLASFCGTAADVAAIPEGLRRVLRPESYRALMSPEGAAARVDPQDPLRGFGLGVATHHEEGHPRWGVNYNNILGYSSNVFFFPGDSLKVVVLANTQPNRSPLARNLARVALGLPLLPAAAPPAPLKSLATTAEERARLAGRYRVRLINPPPQYGAVEETFCVYEEAGQLMARFTADLPFPLLKQGDLAFAQAGPGGTRFRFNIKEGRVVGAELQDNWVENESALRESATCGGVTP